MLESLKELLALIRHFILFCSVSLLNTTLSLAIILFLYKVLHWHYMVSNALGYLAGLGLGYSMHSKITFKFLTHTSFSSAGLPKSKLRIQKFIIIFCVAYLCQLALLFVMVDVLNWGGVLSQIVAVGFYAVLSYTGNRFWTFKAH
jgi:putative flippase GtrA